MNSSSKRALALLLAAGAIVAGGACFDFDGARQTCVTNEKCVAEGPADSGHDAGDEPDAGGMDASTPDAGPAKPCPNGFTLGRVCREGYCWEHPLPLGETLHAVEGLGERAVIVGNAGVALEVNGCDISQIDLPTTASLRGVAVSGETWWIVGSDDNIFMSKGGAPWEQLKAPPGNNYVAIAPAGDGSVHIGARPSSILTLPAKSEPFAPYPFMNLSGLATTDAGLYASFGFDSVSLHDGVGWTPQGGAGSYVRDLWASPTGTIWVAGGLSSQVYRIRPGFPFELAFAAPAFTASGVPSELNAITGDGDNRLWVGGEAGRIFFGENGAWRLVAGNDGGTAPLEPAINDLWSNGGTRVLAVGREGTVLAGRGDDWTLLREAIGQTASPRVYSFAETADGLCAVGQRNFFACRAAGDGGWFAPTLAPADAGHDLHAIAAGPHGTLVAGTRGLIAELLDGGWVHHTVTTAAMEMIEPGDARLVVNALYVTPTSVAIAAGSFLDDAGIRPIVLFRNAAGARFVEPFMLPGVPGTFNAVSGNSTNDIWVGGSTGFIAHWDGVTEVRTPIPGEVTALAATAEGVWFAGTGGAGFVGKTDGTQIVSTFNSLSGVALTPSGPIFSALSGHVYGIDAGALVLLATPTGNTLQTVFVDSDGGVWLGGADESILRSGP